MMVLKQYSSPLSPRRGAGGEALRKFRIGIRINCLFTVDVRGDTFLKNVTSYEMPSRNKNNSCKFAKFVDYLLETLK